ncbi:alpha-ketoglutarate-dependent dioxygenase AlkB [Porticoccaceae bacterium LTM1]|nr:alpha-ketoglutarate-dependent dioxygenase AlkB [Porticoccaceae bacterium LTM1]
MPDLFSNTPQQVLLPGSPDAHEPECELFYVPDFLCSDTGVKLFDELRNQVNWQQDRLNIGGREVAIPRLNAWYGDTGANYSYSGIQLQTHPWFPALTELKEQVCKLANHAFNSALLNYYRDGKDSVAWHSDDEPELGPMPQIASVSLGATRVFQLRHKKTGQRYNLPLESGSLLVMKGATQKYWQHQVPKQLDIIQPRINITFRRVKLVKV